MGDERREMFFSKSMTFDREDLRQAVTTAPVAPLCSTAESEFFEKLRARDAVAFDLLVTKYSPDVYALLCRLTSDPDEAAERQSLDRHG